MEDKSNLIKQSTKWSKIIRTINQPNPSNSLSYGTNKNKSFETKINQPTNQPTKSINQLASFMYGTGTKKLFEQKSIINQPNPSRRLRYQSIIRPKFSQSTNEETVLDSGQWTSSTTSWHYTQLTSRAVFSSPVARGDLTSRSRELELCRLGEMFT